MSLIALMTDFGQRDPFVGIVKGVILGIDPSATLLDVCHEIDPGDIKGAAFALSMAFPYLPRRTILTAVVDPGVGSSRKAVAAEIDGKLVVCPDNGILTWVLKQYPLVKAVELNNSEYHLPEVSETFHGRDIFAPVTAHLSKGTPLDSVGSAITDLTAFPIPCVEASDRSLHGEVIYVDHFGNLITNVTRADLAPWQSKSGLGPVRIHVGSAEIQGIHNAYSDVPKGKAVAIFGSAGYLELAVNSGRAVEALGGVPVGSKILVYQMPA